MFSKLATWHTIVTYAVISTILETCTISMIRLQHLYAQCKWSNESLLPSLGSSDKNIGPFSPLSHKPQIYQQTRTNKWNTAENKSPSVAMVSTDNPFTESLLYITVLDGHLTFTQYACYVPTYAENKILTYHYRLLLPFSSPVRNHREWPIFQHDTGTWSNINLSYYVARSPTA